MYYVLMYYNVSNKDGSSTIYVVPSTNMIKIIAHSLFTMHSRQVSSLCLLDPSLRIIVFTYYLNQRLKLFTIIQKNLIITNILLCIYYSLGDSDITGRIYVYMYYSKVSYKIQPQYLLLGSTNCLSTTYI